MLQLNRRAMIAGLIATAGARPAQAQQSAEDFYKNRPINVYVGYSPGGGYDYYAQLYAQYMPRYLPAGATIVVQHMPGAASLVAANYVFNSAPRDGSALGVVTQTVMLEEAMGTPSVRYNAAKYTWVGRMSSVTEVEIISKRAKAKNFADVRKHETICGGVGPTSPSEGYPRLLNAFAGAKFKIISGYPGAADVMQAIDRGEVDAMENSWGLVYRSKKAALDSGDLSVLVQGALTRNPDLPNVPTVVELGQSDDDKRGLEFYTSSAAVGRAMLGPPGIPPERLKVLRDAFNAVQHDADFLAQVKRTGSEFTPATGEYLQELALKVSETPKQVIARTAQALRP